MHHMNPQAELYLVLHSCLQGTIWGAPHIQSAQYATAKDAAQGRALPGDLWQRLRLPALAPTLREGRESNVLCSRCRECSPTLALARNSLDVASHSVQCRYQGQT